MKAFVAIRGIRMGDGARRVWAWSRRRKVAASVAGAAIVFAVAAGVVVAVDGLPDLALSAPKTVADARAAARAHPNDAAAQRNLGHELWTVKRRRAAIAAYARALAIDRGVADDRLVENLVASFGGRHQRDAEAFIWKHKLVAAQPRLESLVGSNRYGVRWGAVHTLDKLGKGTRGNWERAYVVDLESPDCKIRRNAVDKLGAIGTQRALTALRSAKADDEKGSGRSRVRCLGDRIDSAEEKILARR